MNEQHLKGLSHSDHLARYNQHSFKTARSEPIIISLEHNSHHIILQKPLGHAAGTYIENGNANPFAGLQIPQRIPPTNWSVRGPANLPRPHYKKLQEPGFPSKQGAMSCYW